MRLVRFRHKGLRQLQEDGNRKGVPPAMADKLHKLLFALETAETLGEHSTCFRMEAASAQRRPERILEPDRHGKLAVDFPLRRRDEPASDIDLIDYH